MKGEEERTYLRCMYVYLFRDIRISLWLEYIPVVYTLFAMCFFRTWALSCSSSSGAASQLGGSTRCSVSAHCLLKFVHFLLLPLPLPSLSLPLPLRHFSLHSHPLSRLLFAWCFAVCCLHSSSLFVCSARVTASQSPLPSQSQSAVAEAEATAVAATAAAAHLVAGKVLTQLICIRNPCKSFPPQGHRHSYPRLPPLSPFLLHSHNDLWIFIIFCWFRNIYDLPVSTTLTFLSRFLFRFVCPS